MISLLTPPASRQRTSTSSRHSDTSSSAVASANIGGGAVQQEEEKTMSDEWQTHLDPATNMSYHLNIVTGESRWDEPVESAATATATVTATTATEGQRRASHRHERRTSKLITPVCARKKRIDWSPSSVNLPSSGAPDLRRSKADVPGAAAEGILGEEHPAPRDATKIGLQQSQPPHPPQRLGGMVQHHSSRALNEEDDFL